MWPVLAALSSLQAMDARFNRRVAERVSRLLAPEQSETRFSIPRAVPESRRAYDVVGLSQWYQRLVAPMISGPLRLDHRTIAM
jgi:hypothetical protein